MKNSTFCTTGYHGYNVKFSPFFPNLLACAASQNYGISGRGSLFILEKMADENIEIKAKFDWSDGIFDVTWSELNKSIAVTASGDGSLQVWDISNPQMPTAVLKGHSKEVYGVDWCQTRSDQLLLSASWDKTVILWDPLRAVQLMTFLGHDHFVYGAVWSPHIHGCFASVSGDTTLRIWDIKHPDKPSFTVPVHNAEVLTCDWCKYNPNIIATGAVDGLIRGWDIRNMQEAVFQLIGHEYAVKRVKFSPFKESFLASVSYDFSTRLWEWSTPESVQIFNHHKEFVYGLDFNLHIPDQLADCGWDSFVHIFQAFPV